MTLWDLTQNITLQGNIKVTRFDADLNTETRFFSEVEILGTRNEDLLGHDLTDWEDLEVTYMFANNGWLEIEVTTEAF